MDRLVINREAWLSHAIRLLRPQFTRLDAPLPRRIRASVSFPSVYAMADKNTRIGECWPASASCDGTTEIFITPKLADPRWVLATLAHELAHAALPEKAGHNAAFTRLIRGLRLEGKPSETFPGPAFVARNRALLDALGPFPHAPLRGEPRRPKKQATRMIKVICLIHGYPARVTRKWLGMGAPLCPICKLEMAEPALDRLKNIALASS